MSTNRFTGTGRRRLGADAGMAVAILALGTVLTGSGARLAQRLQTAAARHQSLSFEDHLGAAANAAGLIVVVWWALSFLIAVASALLERRGNRGAAAATGKFSPAFMRRLALAAVGLQLAAAPLAHADDAPGTATAAPAAVAAVWVPGGGPNVPPATGIGLNDSAPPASQSPAPDAAGSTAGAEPLGLDPRWTPAPQPAEPRDLAPAPRRPRPQAADMEQVTVRAGDSLWSICAAQLGPLASDVDIALAWPRLYDANRILIGSDPGLLLPGQVLQLPANP